MKTVFLIAAGLCIGLVAALPAPAHAKTMKECAAQWDQMKAANQTAGMKYRDFTKQCMSGEAAPAAAPSAAETKPAPAPGAETKPVAKPAATTEAGAKPASPGRQAMIARERACGAEWKELKASGKRPAGMKWPQFWHECDQRKKAEGM